MSKLTKRFVESIAVDPLKPLKFWDAEIKGFGLVVLPSGRRTYCIQYRNPHRILKRLKLGVHGQITAENARVLAKKYLGEVAQGHDPAEKKKEMKGLSTMKDLITDYLERHGKRKRVKSLLEDQKLIKNFILPSLSNMKVAHISRRDIESLHLRMEKTPYQANRVLALLSKMFSLAIGWGWRDENPVSGLQHYPEVKRDRWLNEKELQKLWDVLDQYPQHITTYVFKLLILTGSRKSEVLNATWDQFNLQQGVWTKPSHLTKQNKKEHLPLSERTTSMLQHLRTLHQDPVLLFPGKVGGKPLQEIKNFWKKILHEAGVENCRVHDLRHTYASHLVSSGLSLSIVGKLLGHTQVSTTQRYAHLADEPLRAATEVFGQKVEKMKVKVI